MGLQPDTMTNSMQKYTIAPHDLNSTVNLAAIYHSQLAIVMQVGTVKSLNPKKMIIPTQTNQPQQENAYVPGDEFYRQMAALPDAQKPAGYGVWTEYLTWDPAGCSYHDAVRPLSGICQVGTSAGCPPNVQAFTAPPTPGSTVSLPTGGSGGSTSGSTSNKTGTTTRSASAASPTPSAAGANAGAFSVSNNAVSQGRSFCWELMAGAVCVLVALVGVL
ncbi:hypothetical protein M427DRAFT_157108 [Gonapodya prolifera JEL478]|uniref:Uncharacterized protein n=1 Tax=Gonapodya prolifera (strain JEL478) TaxID=1344416 RepID=A0A139A7N6_GONPJ|nr:hypothetical protein M427DRAFT_157108 [Gonapodya prolifera JEL478]|eukprot:KXS12714.1 hypothetical protein M427DRAFT_157108 [Gonapodya prolifera JEL478]